MTIITQTFNSYRDAQNAVVELQNNGFDSEDITLIANDADQINSFEQQTVLNSAGTGAGVGAAVGGAGGLLAGLGLVAIPGIGPVVAGGWLAATLAGMASGAAVGAATGGIISALSEQGLSEEEAKFYAEHVRKGGTLVCVRTADEDAQTEAHGILVRHRNAEVGSPAVKPRGMPGQSM